MEQKRMMARVLSDGTIEQVLQHTIEAVLKGEVPYEGIELEAVQKAAREGKITVEEDKDFPEILKAGLAISGNKPYVLYVTLDLPENPITELLRDLFGDKSIGDAEDDGADFEEFLKSITVVDNFEGKEEEEEKMPHAHDCANCKLSDKCPLPEARAYKGLPPLSEEEVVKGLANILRG